jgi:hypothetical protein
LTPTPTPELDPSGRRVYTVSNGRFLFIVEGGLGQSGSQPGFEGTVIGQINNTVAPINHFSGRPSVQVLPSENLGNGSSRICDVGPPFVGGVPGFDPPHIDCNDLSGQELIDCQNQVGATTNALVDMACRFLYVSGEGTACTRNQFGAFQFLNSGPEGSTRQYCFQIPSTAALHVGETVFAAQLRDQQGNLGPLREIVIRVLEP